MPRKQASRTTLVKKVRNRTWAGNQRMQASCRNRSRTLTMNRSPAGPRGPGRLGAASVLKTTPPEGRTIFREVDDRAGGRAREAAPAGSRAGAIRAGRRLLPFPDLASPGDEVGSGQASRLD